MLNICSSKHMTIIMIFSLDPGIYLGSQFPSMSVTPCGVEFIRVSGEDSSYKSLGASLCTSFFAPFVRSDRVVHATLIG